MSNAAILKRARARDITELLAARQTRFAVDVLNRSVRLPERAVGDVELVPAYRNTVRHVTLYVHLRRMAERHDARQPLEALTITGQVFESVRREKPATRLKRATRQRAPHTAPDPPPPSPHESAKQRKKTRKKKGAPP